MCIHTPSLSVLRALVFFHCTHLHAGSPYAVTEMRGDWQWHVRFWKLSCWWARPHICHACDATSGNWQQVHTDHQARSHANFVVNCLPRYVNPMATIQYFNASMLRFCSMHCINLGILQYLLGSVVVLLAETYDFFGAGSWEVRLTELLHRFKLWASASRIPHSQSSITKGMLFHSKQHTDFPCLTLKAYNARVMLPFLARCLGIAFKSCQTDCELGLAYACCQRLSAFFDLLERSPRYLTPAQAELLETHGLRYSELYMRLAKISVSQGKLRWKLIPKHHVFVEHLVKGMRQSEANIRYTHCFIDEDFIGTIKALCRRVHPRLLEMRVLGRWLLRLKVWKPAFCK